MIKVLTKHTKFRDYLFLLIVCCIGFWQISLLQNIVKWDIVDINLPWRYFISECLRNGHLPLWNPFINCGFPQEADPMAWYPVSWIIGVVFGNSLVSLQYEFVFHIFIGGVGFYKLGEHLGFERVTRIAISISFMFSGLFVSNAQHYGWVVSAAWFPLILYNFLKVSSGFNYKNGISFILVLFFQLTGGYTGFFVITIYILLAVFISNLVIYSRNKKAIKYILTCSIITGTFLILSSVVLVSSFKVIPFLTRTNQISADFVNSFALPFKALVSFILPFATTVDTGFWGTDLSLLNCYYGIIPLIFTVYALFAIKSKNIRIIFIIGLLFLSIALAEVFPFRKWLYYLPLMNLFRFPTIFRFFGYFSFILVAGYGINYFLKEGKRTKLLEKITYTFIGLLVLVFIYNALNIELWKFKSLVQLNFKEFLLRAAIPERLFLQAFALSIILITFLLILKISKRKNRTVYLVAIVAIDLILAVQLNIYQTVVSFKKPMPTQIAVNSLPRGFPAPSLNEKINEINNTSTPGIPTLWRNLNIFYKKTSFEGYSPYYFKSTLKSQQEKCFYPIINNPLLFFAGSIESSGLIDTLSIDTTSSEKIEIASFNPNKIEALVKTNQQQLLTFIQNYYPGWKAYINGEEVNIIKSNYTFMSIWVPEGENQVIFSYKPLRTIISFYISAITFLLLIVLLIILNTKKARKHLA